MYNIGTVTTTANSPKITGTGTRWKDNTTLISVGQVVLIENGSNLLINSIYSIESNTALTLAFPVSAKLTNAKYIILTTMIDSISDGVNKATAQVIASEVYTEILNQWMTDQGTIDVELPTGQKIKLRTVAEMDKQLDGKFDKTGGTISGKGEALILKKTDANAGIYLRFKEIDESVNIGYVGFGTKDKILTIANQAAGSALTLDGDKKLKFNGVNLLTEGGFGLGASNINSVPKELDFNANKARALGFFYINPDAVGTPSGKSEYGGGIFFGRDPAVSTKMLYSPDWSTRLFLKSPTGATSMSPWIEFYSTGNTTKDSNGNLKAASPIIRVFADHVDPNDEAEGVTLKKLHTGIYQLHGVLGLHSDASWGGINGGITIPCGINQLPLVYALYDVLEKGKPHPFDGRIVEPNEDGDIVLYTSYRQHDLPQNIQYERFKLYPEFLRDATEGEESIPGFDGKVELTPGEPCDIPAGHWIDVRVNMPSNSIYNQKQAEAERLAKIEAERLAEEEAKRAAEEAERAEQEAIIDENDTSL
ncbi:MULTISPECIES: hypothetical protein [unclassified Providencia]|uniref:phage tail fiber protein n=1 Tax=unclassified Providencia TaxID=2633465 RepID=UPI003C2F120E